MRLPRGAVPKPSIRLRLTLWYGALFLLAGTVLLALNFALVARNFPSDGADLRETIEHRLELEPGELRGEFFFVVQRSQAPTSPPGVRRGVPATPLFNSVVSHIKTDTLQQIVWQSSIALALMAVALDRPRLVRRRADAAARPRDRRHRSPHQRRAP